MRAGGEYLAIEAAADKLTLITTAAIKGTKPIETQRAIGLAADAIGLARPVLRSVLACPAWRLSAAEEADGVAGE